MKITHITSQLVPIPMVRTFTTSLRSISEVESILVTVHTDENHKGYGSAAPVPVITGETVESIIGAVTFIGEQLSGMSIENAELIFQNLTLASSAQCRQKLP